jgi:hypothetical protein
MNKTTRKYGKPLYVITLRCIWGEKPPDSVLRNWARLDKYAQLDHHKNYDSLTDAQKVQIHYNLNAGIYREQEKQERMKNASNQKSNRTEVRTTDGAKV